MAIDKQLSAVRATQGSVTLTGSTLIPMVKANESIVGTIDEIAVAISGYTSTELVAQARIGAKAIFTANAAGTNDGVVVWNGFEYDGASMINGGDGTRITVPAGATAVAVDSCIEIQRQNVYLKLFKNGGADPVYVGSIGSTSSGVSNWASLSVSYIPCTAGDYFQVGVYSQPSSAAGTLIASQSTYFAVTVVEKIV